MSYVSVSDVEHRHPDLSEPPPPAGHYLARLACSPATRRDMFQLRYESYLDQCHILPNETGLFSDQYDFLPNSRSIVLYDALGAVASVRMCLLGLPGEVAPATEAFPDQLGQLLRQLGPGRRAAEITRLVRSPATANNQSLVFLLYRLANYVGFVEQVWMPLASVRRNHAVFYRRLGFEAVSEPHPYPGLTCPMQLMACDRIAYEDSFRRFPLIDPFAPGADCLDGLLAGKPVRIKLLQAEAGGA